MSASLTLEAFGFDFYNRHFNLPYSSFTYKYIPMKYISQEVLTITYFYAILLYKDIARRYRTMDTWQERGLVIANSNTVEKNKLGWKVPSQSSNGTYIVNLDDSEPFCTCQHFETTRKKCQHIYAVEFITKKVIAPDGTETLTKSVKLSYTQEWTSYNQAQTHEQEHFVTLLRDLCNGIEQPTQTLGRPRLPLSDIVFAIVYKSYSTMSGRRFNCDLQEALNNGLISKVPHYNSAFRYLENPELTPLLKVLIEQSASPLKAIETDFAVDSSGFSTSTYARWFDHKWGKERIRQTWVKTHLICGTKTHVVTSVEATPCESADSIQLPNLVNQTAKTFNVNEVSADKAYLTRQNLHAVEAVGGTAYIPFKVNSTSRGGTHHKFDGLWARMWHFYNYNQETFLQHYHKRSNVETTFSMIKSKFGASVRSKLPTSQVNEVLCKIVCHNICVLIQSMYELGLNPTFDTFEAKELVAPKVFNNTAF